MKRVLLWTPAVLQMAFIFAASSVPGSQLPSGIWDKLAHLLVYAALGAFLMLPLSRGRMAGITGASAAAAVVISLLYGVSDEIHQMFTPGRSPDVMDVVADTIGASAGVLGVCILAFLWRRLAARSSTKAST
jgi:VanZ family protein